MKKEININKIKDLIIQGYTNKEISKEINIHISSLRRLLKKHNLIRYKKIHRIITDEEKTQIITLYKNNNNCLDIAKILFIHRVSIANILKDNGFEIKRKIMNTITQKECSICDKKICNRRNICQSCYTHIRRYKIKKKMIEYKGGKCIKCDDDSLDISCYDFHHLNPNEKDFMLSAKATQIPWNKIVLELDKCVMLCSNCHRKEHSNHKNTKFLAYIESLK